MIPLPVSGWFYEHQKRSTILLTTVTPLTPEAPTASCFLIKKVENNDYRIKASLEVVRPTGLEDQPSTDSQAVILHRLVVIPHRGIKDIVPLVNGDELLSADDWEEGEHL